MTIPKIPILSLDSKSYAKAIKAHLGKGADHAVYLYQEWFRKGFVTDSHPAFANAKSLFEEIKQATDWSLLEAKVGRDDGITEKLLFKTKEGLEIETVIVPMEAGGTLCISSQVGCRMGCSFCETGRLGLLKNLSAAEIVGQVFLARHRAKGNFRNIVFMGMGEPFDNFEAVIQAFRVISDPNGINIGPRHITISTSGKVEEIYRFADFEENMPNLAVSISAPSDLLRNKLMPINRKMNLEKLHEAIAYYNRKTGRQVLAAYVLMRDVNDYLECADQLANYLEGLDVKVNLIPYNPRENDRYQTSLPEQVAAFKHRLIERNLRVLVRTTKGDKIMAACGQLGNIDMKKKLLVYN
jgi:23S rRNA (adenine2503-C2)-methyltransferase